MNKTLLLFIVDFLFLNLIALTRWERAEPARERQPPVNAISANAVSRDQDLVEAMRQSLADEQLARQGLEQKLQSSDSTLAARERSLGQLQADSQKLTAQLVDTQRARADLGIKYEAVTQENALTRSQLAELQRQLEDKKAEAERQKQALVSLEKQQQDARKQIEGLIVSVALSEQEKQALASKASELEAQVQAERTERVKVEQATKELAQGVGQLAESSGALTKEIRDNRPISANLLYSDFLSNRVETAFSATRRGLFGRNTRDKETKTVFTTDGKQVYALLEVARAAAWSTAAGTDCAPARAPGRCPATRSRSASTYTSTSGSSGIEATLSRAHRPYSALQWLLGAQKILCGCGAWGRGRADWRRRPPPDARAARRTGPAL